MSAMDAIFAKANGIFYSLGGREITYRRGSETGTLTAIPNDEERMTYADNGMAMRIWLRVWLIKVADLPFGLPQRGDEILQGAEVFEALPHEDEPAWRYADDTRTEVRILTKQISGS